MKAYGYLMWETSFRGPCIASSSPAALSVLIWGEGATGKHWATGSSLFLNSKK